LAPDNRTLYFYVGGQHGFSHSCVGPGSQTGVAKLRRDGYAAMQTSDTESGVVTTAPVIFPNDRSELFVNFAGSLSVEVIDSVSLRSLVGPSQLLTGDSTSENVHFNKLSALKPFAGRELRFRFTLAPATRLYSFWPARDQCGASFGFLGGGGPGAPDGMDSNGMC
jgi:hypothetical protein